MDELRVLGEGVCVERMCRCLEGVYNKIRMVRYV